MPCDNANSLHTNAYAYAYDEAVTTPSEESVRRALAIPLAPEGSHGSRDLIGVPPTGPR